MTSDRDLRAAVEALTDECASSACIHLNDLYARLRAILAEHPATSGEATVSVDLRATDRMLIAGGNPALAEKIREVNCTCGHGPEPAEIHVWDCPYWDGTYPAETPCSDDPTTAVSDAGGEGLTDGPCDECGLRYVAWWIDNEAWNHTLGGPGATDDPGGMLCPGCFMVKAAPIRGAWHLTNPDRERVLRDRIAELEAERNAEAIDAAHDHEAAEALASERGDRLAAVQASVDSMSHGGLCRPDECVCVKGDLTAALGPEAADLLADRERRAEARGAERALREAAEAIDRDPSIRLKHNVAVVCSCVRCETAMGAARLLRDRADRIAGEGQ